MSHLTNLYNYRDLLMLWTGREIRVRYKQSLLGVGWAIIQPLVLTVVFTLVFSRIMQVNTGGVPYPIFAYAALVPDGGNWKATLLIEYPDPHERKRELARLIGVEDRMFVEVEGHARIYAIADEDMERENDEKTSAVHFVRFEFAQAAREAVRAGAQVKLGCDHTNYPAHTLIAPETLASLAGDLA